MAAPVDPSAAFRFFMGVVLEPVTVKAVDRETGTASTTVLTVDAGRSPPGLDVFGGPESGEGPQSRVTWYVRGDQIAGITRGLRKGDTVTDADGVVYVVEATTAPPGNTLGTGLWAVETLKLVG